MTFNAGLYDNFIAAHDPVFQRVSPSYTGADTAFDIVIIGSGMGGGVLADALADRFGNGRRILVLEAGSFLYPTHVYNCSRLPNDQVARRFGCGNFTQAGNSGQQDFIGERPQLNFGGRSIFWSGLIPALQPWELDFFPAALRQELEGGLLDEAGLLMNEAVSMGDTAQGIVDRLRASPLAADFIIEQTPRALHQPYLQPGGVPVRDFFVESTGVFNTAELLVNQLKLSGDQNSGGRPEGLNLLLNHYAEDIRRLGDGRLEVVTRNTLNNEARSFQAGRVVLAAGSIESPKLMKRSTIGRELDGAVQDMMGRGLTDHPTTDTLHTLATHIGDFPIPRNSTAKIIFYSRGLKDGGRTRFPFNIEMNVNHEYWHLRENDPSAPETPVPLDGTPVVDIKFSFGNPLDPANEIRPCPPFGYVPEIVFRNQSWTSHLCGSRFPALAGWQMNDQEVFGLLNDLAERIFARFSSNGTPCAPMARMGQGKGFGWGTVHHAVGSLRMPGKERHDGPFLPVSVVDEQLQVVGAPGLYVCDMSVMPFSSAANPVRHLVALALRLARHLP
ncbi:GMC oxidoreductase [Teichococcus oryzae]|uniref:GMC family oxidoreductase n=1 Tax=Teichococcus oryzae TaxID=1608942 RepID=A0A5B2TEJ7_9PROT|nr:GMC oxidoreductase [Pseudoroseomonas oryzae]KAA2212926.1 GMC family oxidoreductase [Pseudoroseomonas oryzae]